MLLIAGLRISALSQPPTGFLPKPVAILLPQALPPPPSVLIRRPSPLLPYAPDSLLPLPPLHPDRAFWTLPVTLPVNHTFHFGSPSTAYTGPVIHCLPVPLPSVIRPPDQCRPRTPYPFHILHPPAFNYPPPPTPLYLTHKTPPTLTHWWLSTWGAQPRHPTDRSPPLTHQPIDLHLPTPCITKHTLRTYINARHEDTWYRHLYSAIWQPPVPVLGRLQNNSKAPSPD